jgi:hypothetical protein
MFVVFLVCFNFYFAFHFVFILSNSFPIFSYVKCTFALSSNTCNITLQWCLLLDFSSNLCVFSQT